MLYIKQLQNRLQINLVLPFLSYSADEKLVSIPTSPTAGLVSS